jgi:hypothetical protein
MPDMLDTTTLHKQHVLAFLCLKPLQRLTGAFLVLRIILVIGVVFTVTMACSRHPVDGSPHGRIEDDMQASGASASHQSRYKGVHFQGGWRTVPLPMDSYSLVFRQSSHLSVLDPGQTEPRRVQIAQGFGCFWSTPVWSADGASMFDCEGQVIAVSSRTGEARALTSYPVSRGWRDGWKRGWPARRPTGEAPRFVHDAANNTLYAVTVSNKVHPEQSELARLIAINLSDGSHGIVLDGKALQEQILSWALSLKRGRFYGATSSGVTVWSLDGEKIGERASLPGEVRELSLSPDDETLLAEMFRRGSREEIVHLGAWLLDAESLETTNELQWGHSFRWSSDGGRIAFLKLSEELWIFNIDDASLERLAWVLPSVDAPEWSRCRYFASPAWSGDDCMLACGLASHAGPSPHEYNFYTLILDLAHREARVIPEYWTYLSWSPVLRPFVQGERQ